MDEILQDESNVTREHSALIRQFLVAAAEIHGREVTVRMAEAYESALSGLPTSELRIALNETLRSERFWPTPAHVRERWESHGAIKDQAEAEQAWDAVLERIRRIGRTASHSFDDSADFALRAIGGYGALCNSIPESDHRFVRKTFIEAYCRFCETAGFIGPSRAEARRVIEGLPNGLVEKALES